MRDAYAQVTREHDLERTVAHVRRPHVDLDELRIALPERTASFVELPLGEVVLPRVGRDAQAALLLVRDQLGERKCPVSPSRKNPRRA